MHVQDKMALDVQSAVERLSARHQEPAWVRERRLEAWRLFQELPMPKWDRTDLRGLDLSEIVPYADPEPDAPLPQELERVVQARRQGGSLLLQRNAHPVLRDHADELAAKGVIFTDLVTAVKEHAALVQPHFMTEAVLPNEDKFVALHAALWSGGAFVYVPRGVDVDIPLQINFWADAAGLGVFPHVLVVADRDSRVTIVESTASQDAGQRRVVCGVVEVIAKEGAQVTYGSIQNWGRQTWNFTVRRALVSNDASCDWILGEIGSKLSRSGFYSMLQGNGSRSRNSTLFFGDDSQHLDVINHIIHIGKNTEGDMETKGALKDRARSVYRGLTQIRRGARETTAFQKANTLLLSPDARNDAIPGLEIDEDSVKAGHAATAGQVDEEHLFYLQSRGLTRSKALELIVAGFFEPMMQRIPLEGVRNEIQRLIDGKMA